VRAVGPTSAPQEQNAPFVPECPLDHGWETDVNNSMKAVVLTRRDSRVACALAHRD